MNQPHNPPDWASHWCPPFGDSTNNPEGFWLGNMDNPFPLFRGVTWNPKTSTKKLGGKGGLIYLGARPLEGLEND